MPVATILAIAASFWGAHGHTIQQPVTWEWDLTTQEQTAGLQARATYGSNHVVIVRDWWDHATNQDRCVVLIHEDGHAVFSFDHAPGIMAEYDEDRPIPGICKQSRARWRALAK